MTGPKMSEKAASVERKTLKAWRTVAQDHFKNNKVEFLGSKI